MASKSLNEDVKLQESRLKRSKSITNERTHVIHKLKSNKLKRINSENLIQGNNYNL